MLFLYFVVIPVLWVGIGGFSAGVFQSMGNIEFKTQAILLLILIAPLTFLFLLCILVYGYSLRLARQVSYWLLGH